MVESCFHRTAPSSSRLRNFQITSLLRQARVSDLQATLPGKEEHVRRPKSQHETKKTEGKCFASLTCCRCRRRRLPRRRQQLHVSSTSPHRSNEQPRHSPPPSLVPLYSSPSSPSPRPSAPRQPYRLSLSSRPSCGGRAPSQSSGSLHHAPDLSSRSSAARWCAWSRATMAPRETSTARCSWSSGGCVTQRGPRCLRSAPRSSRRTTSSSPTRLQRRPCSRLRAPRSSKSLQNTSTASTSSRARAGPAAC